MIRPNLRSFAAAVACLALAPVAVNAQEGIYGGPGNPAAFRLPQSPYQAPIQDHYIRGNTTIWDENRPIERLFSDVADRSWIRLEFLMWNNSAGHELIGAPVSGLQANSRGQLEGHSVPVQLIDNLNGGVVDTGHALFPNASTLSNLDVPGVRGTWGLDLNGADMEMSFFGLEQSSSTQVAGNLSAARTFVGLLTPEEFGTPEFPNVAVPLLTDGNVTTVANLDALIFTESFSQKLETQMWGSEVTFLTDSNAPGGAGASFQWLGGFRYVNIDSTYGFTGTSVNIAATTVNSFSINNFYGPEAGARLALSSKYITVSATPRVMLGINDNSSTISSVIQGVDGTTHFDRNVDFGTITQVNLQTEIHLTEAFSVFGGYDIMALTGVSKPLDNVRYNSVTNALGDRTADINQDIQLQNLVVYGFSVGAVFRY
ncbi:MAG: BBP7 family outer membrane beta-barrel protein [Planctomycetaceae bacterium]